MYNYTETKENDIEGIKTVLIGDSGVGKTSIIKQFTSNNFEEETNSTSGGQYNSKKIKIKEIKKEIKLDIWDTAGQEIYHSLAKLFYKDAKIIIFVYDIANSKSFENIQKYWYPQIKADSLKDAILVLVANKNDLQYQQVNDKEVKSFADSIGAILYKTSAKSNSSVNVLFEIVGRIILDPNYDYKKAQYYEYNGIESASVKLNKNISKKKHKKNCC